jgi:hypothetical protein
MKKIVVISTASVAVLIGLVATRRVLNRIKRVREIRSSYNPPSLYIAAGEVKSKLEFH